jgi:hypothetical protein
VVVGLFAASVALEVGLLRSAPNTRRILMDMSAIHFPEPAVDDPTYALTAEGMVSWLERSTIARARGYRAFLNRNLKALPVEAGEKIAAKMRSANFEHAHFEMIVGRLLQLLGADLINEPQLPDGHHPDWSALFGDGEILVECTCPAFNPIADQQRSEVEPAAALVERYTPDGWSAVIYRVPHLGPGQRRQEVKTFLKRELASLPPAATATAPVEIEAHLAVGSVHLELLPKRYGHLRVVAGPPTGHWGDDTAQRIRDAYRTKRGQVRAATVPTLLAIHGGPWQSRAAFDLGLLGIGDQSEVDDEPAFVMHRTGSPVFAGVLAFTGNGRTTFADPILYRHPRFSGQLPAAFGSIEARSLQSGVVVRAGTLDRAQPLLAQLSAGIEIP